MLYLKYANITGKQPEIHLIVIIPDEENFLPIIMGRNIKNIVMMYQD